MSDSTLAYSASVAYSISLASVAPDGSFLAGRSSAVVDFSTPGWIDAEVGGTIKLGPSGVTAGVVEVWAWGVRDDAPTYFDNFDGTDKNVSVTSRTVLNAFARQIARVETPATNGILVPFWIGSLAMVFGGHVPHRHGVWVVHSTGANLDGTNGNHAIYYKPAYYTST